ncbi:MAG: AAA family ATPase, partial [Dehalococcoidia bacterium]
MFDSIDDVAARLAGQEYFAGREIATTVFLAARLNKPLFLEGEAGVGKTEIAKALAATLGTRLIRLQCYEGLDAHHALYEWNYAKQLLRIKLAEAGHEGAGLVEREIFSEEYLIRRPLLEALSSEGGLPPVLLIDEVDRADEEFEAFLLEILSDFQITIPELGTIKAARPPLVILTSNRTREIHDALKRRCLYLWVGYPTFERELEIVRAKVPGLDAAL